MGDAFAWVGQIVAWFGAFIPRWAILNTTEEAVKFVGGSKVVVCTTGIHWYWPATTEFIAYPVVRQTDRLDSQTLESADGKTFLVSAMIIYRVVDLAALIPTTHNAQQAIADIAMSAVHDVLCQYDWADIQSMQRRNTLKTQLRNEAQKQLKDYGVEVIKLQINTLARCRVIKLSQSTSSEEN